MATTVSYHRVLKVGGGGKGLTLGSLRALVEQANAVQMSDDSLVIDGLTPPNGGRVDYLEVVEGGG